MKEAEGKLLNRKREVKDTIVVGKILKPRGLDGELKANISHQLPLGIFIDGCEYKIEKSSLHGGFSYICLAGVTAVEQAEALRGKSIEVKRCDLSLAPDEVLIDDIIGFDVIGTNGKKIGKLINVESVGAGEIFETETISFPNEDAFVVETNMHERKIIVREQMLEEIIVL